MIDKSKVRQTIGLAVDEVNTLLPPEARLDKSAETELFGGRGKLDSLGLVNLIVAVEQKTEEAFGFNITLVDENAMSRSENPFSSLGTLADYVEELLEAKRR